METLDVASISVAEWHSGQGMFTAFMEAVIAANPWDAVFVENVMNPFLVAYFKARPGWVESKLHPKCYYLLKGTDPYGDHPRDGFESIPPDHG